MYPPTPPLNRGDNGSERDAASEVARKPSGYRPIAGCKPADAPLANIIARAATFGERTLTHAAGIGRMKAFHEFKGKRACSGQSCATWPRVQKLLKRPVGFSMAVEPAEDLVQFRPEVVEAPQRMSVRSPSLAAIVENRERGFARDLAKLRRYAVHEFGAELDRHGQRWIMARENPSADPFACLEYGELDAGVAQHACRGKSGDTGANDDYIDR